MWRRLYTKLSEEEELRRAEGMMAIAAAPPANATEIGRLASILQVWIFDSVSASERQMMAKALITNICEAVGLPKPTFPSL